MPLIDVPTVHAVTDPQILRGQGFKSKAASMFRALGPAVAVHLRGAGMPAIELYRLAEFLAPLQDETGGWLVINDRLDVALGVGATGVQLRHDSLSPQDCRRVTGHSLRAPLFGISVHDQTQAADAITAGATWVMAGNVFETATHPGRPGKGAAFISAVGSTGAVVIAIGGILPVHAAQLRAHGAHGVAAIRGIWSAHDPVSAARAYL